MSIIHPYGSLGPLTWQSQNEGIEFGADIDGARLARISQRILTFNESVADEVQAAAREAIQNARLIMFLGFAYHEQNMRFLEVKNYADAQIFGTAAGFSDFDKAVIQSDFVTKFGIPSYAVHLYDGYCSGIFSEYSRALRLVGI